MNDIQIIQQKIHEIRGQRVMLDRDLAAIYGVETKRLNEAVRRNALRFEGDDFMFRLTKDEEQSLCSRSQFATLNKGRGLNTKYLPYAFIELGVAMLSSVLRSETAIKVNRDIMRAFVAFRHLAATLPPTNTAADLAQLRQDFEDLKLDIEDILSNQNDINEDTRAQLELINQSLAALQSTHKQPRRPIIGFSISSKEEP